MKKNEFKLIMERINVISAETVELKNEVSRINSVLVVVQNDIKVLKKDVEEVKKDMVQVKKDISNIDKRLTKLEVEARNHN